MNKSEFEVMAKNIIANILYLIPDGQSVRVYKSGDYYSVECGRFEYQHYDADDIRVTAPMEVDE